MLALCGERGRSSAMWSTPLGGTLGVLHGSVKGAQQPHRVRQALSCTQGVQIDSEALTMGRWEKLGGSRVLK